MNINKFDFELPDEKIPKHPLEKRSCSKLLKYDKGEITHHSFSSIADHLPKNSLLLLNDTEVIPARFHFNKATGANIEIFLLKPVEPSPIVSQGMEAKGGCSWKCMIGNKKRWKGETLKQKISIGEINLTLEVEWPNHQQDVVSFKWNSNQISFSEIVEEMGKVPIPPYLNREPVLADKERYQTVYSRVKGAVAAPTAGLHFDDHILSGFSKKEIKTDYLTLHVGAGTFQPIKSDNVLNHEMHSEQIMISQANIQTLMDHDGPIIPVGTTSLRSLESLYWYGVALMHDPNSEFKIKQDQPYKTGFKNLPSRNEVLKTIFSFMERREKNSLIGETGIFIRPDYHFQMCDGLVTNFHQPKSTLILLVAALIGNDWRKVYNEALDNDYRFLSYGDSSLLLPAKDQSRL